MSKKNKRSKRYKSSPAKTLKALQIIIEYFNQNKNLDKKLLAEILEVSECKHEGELISAKDAAQVLACSTKKLANDRVAGDTGLPHVKFGSRVYYKRSDIADFIERNVRISTSDKGGAK